LVREAESEEVTTGTHPHSLTAYTAGLSALREWDVVNAGTLYRNRRRAKKYNELLERMKSHLKINKPKKHNNGRL